MAYCTASDLYGYGVPRGSIPNPGRLIVAVDTTAHTLELGEHGFSDGDPVTFRAESGGSLPAPLVAGTTYYAIEISDSLFQVAATDGGAAVLLATEGSRIVAIAPLPIAKAIAYASGVIDDSVPAQVVPIENPPAIIVATCAELAAAKLGYFAGAVGKTLADVLDAAQKRLDRWAAGAAVRGAGGQTSAASAASASVPYDDPTGWSRFGSL